MSFSAGEKKKLQKQRIAVFEDRVIFEAEPPLGDGDLTKIAAGTDRAIPEGLIALWRTTSGGRLPYSLEAHFDGTIAVLPITQIFCPKIDGRNHDDISFAGDEPRSRVAVSGDGEVILWHEGRTARIGRNLAAFFHALELDGDALADARAEVGEIKDAQLHAKLRAIVDQAALDWRAAWRRGDLTHHPRLVRAALADVIERDDVAWLERLAKAGVDLDMQVLDRKSALDLAPAAGKCARYLLGR